jgi:hypothetical protein
MRLPVSGQPGDCPTLRPHDELQCERMISRLNDHYQDCAHLAWKISNHNGGVDPMRHPCDSGREITSGGARPDMTEDQILAMSVKRL